MANLGKIIYLSEAQKNELFANGTVTSNNTVITYNENDIYITPDQSINKIYLNGVAYTPINGSVDLGTIVGGEHTQTITGTTVSITGVAGYRYKCGEVATLSVTPPSAGTVDIIFSSGSTATVLTLPNTVRMPEWWNGPEANYTYELMITDGVYGAVMSWAN